ncbi:Hpt domain-containing protein [Telmatospirillum siberiense]|nr:Hpt domain-containing protein [Telmatospirillum siberiense]
MTSWNSEKILDPGPLTEAFGSIDADARKTLELFLTSTRPLLGALQMKLLTGDLSGAAAAAHSAKGAANVTGAFRLGSLCAEICTLLRQGDGERAQALAIGLPDAFAEVQEAIRRL